ncbi:hypothetical protein GVAV_001054 [Gurleya vavrai]
MDEDIDDDEFIKSVYDSYGDAFKEIDMKVEELREVERKIESLNEEDCLLSNKENSFLESKIINNKDILINKKNEALNDSKSIVIRIKQSIEKKKNWKMKF